MSQVYHESELQFSFRDDWKVLRYDAHKYYRIVSGRSFSGIDFACITDQEELLLIEVKNYYQYNNQGHVEDIDEFAAEMKEKILDTIDLINIIYKYHNRKFMYRLCFNLVRKWPRLQYDWWYWTKMYDLHLTADKIKFILILESAADNDDVKEQVIKLIEAEDASMHTFEVVTAKQSIGFGFEII